MPIQIFRVKKPSRKILKTKNCVPFEVQYYSIILAQYRINYAMLHCVAISTISFIHIRRVLPSSSYQKDKEIKTAASFDLLPLQKQLG